MNAIETRGLTKYYGKARGIVNINLDVADGEIYGFIGPNGSGKSTTIRTLLNFLHPSAGSAKIFGKDCGKDIRAIKQEIGYLPSEVNYYDDMTVRELLQYSAKFYQKDCSKRLQELADLFDVNLSKKIYSLSLGNKKKVGIVQTLLHSPRLLILDEPTSGLDPLMQNRFFETLHSQNKQGVTVFFSSHILSEVQKLCHKVAIIKEGQLLRVEEIETLRSRAFRRVKLEFSEGSRPFGLPGITRMEIHKSSVEFLYNGEIGPLLKEITALPLRNVWIEEPSLEELFLHYYEEGDNSSDSVHARAETQL